MSKAREIVETLRTVLVAGDVTNANFTGADLEVGKGGTGASSAGAARTALGLVVGTDVLAPNGSAANLTNLPAGGAEDFVASGTLPNGSPVILKANGQVEVVSGSGGSQSIPLGSEVVYNSGTSYDNMFAFDPSNSGRFVVVYNDGGNSFYGTAIAGLISGSSISFGSEVVFNAAQVNGVSIDFDPNTAGKFCVVYMDEGNSNAGAAIIGTMSGTSLSFGSEVVFQANSRGIKVAFDPNNANKLVIVYRDWAAGGYGNAIVGTVSGTSVSFATKVVFATQNINFIGLAFDPSTTNKLVISYIDITNSNYGRAIVGTISGTGISFGSSEYFNTGETTYTDVAFDPSNANKCVIVFKDSANSNFGTARVATVSGTGISFGSEVVFNAGDSTYTSVSFDPNRANKCAIAYRDSGNLGYATVIEGTVSGTGISFGSEVVVNSGASNIGEIAFDPNVSGKFLVTYGDAGNSEYGTAILGQFDTLVTNLTATNFLGTATAAYTNGQTASIMLKGGISDNQTSLTAGSTYYVQTNGTFATSAGTPSVLAGEAVSATSLLLNGLATPAAPDEIPSQTSQSGKFLTTDGSAASWGTVAPAGLVLLGTVTGSNAATIAFGDVMSSTYHTYVIYGEGIYPSYNNDYLNFRVKMGGSFSSASMYNHASVGYRSSTDSPMWQGGYGTTEVFLSTGLSNSSSQGGGLTLHIHNPNATATKTGFDWTHSCQRYSTETLFYTGGGSINNSMAITGIRFACNNGNISGTFRIYGVLK